MSRIVEYVSGGSSPGMLLPKGKHLLFIRATTWNGASVTLQEAENNVAGEYVNSDDPYNTGNDLTRTANGKGIVAYGGCYIRLAVTGSPTGLTLTRQDAE